MGHIFLSYAREDRACAEHLARVLESGGHSVWWDRHIDSGEEFSAQIEAELDRADAVLVAWSANSVRSRWVRDEAAVGGDREKLVPVSIDGIPPPMGFRQFHTLDLTGWKGGKRDGRTAELLHAVERRLTASGERPASASTPRPSAPRPSHILKWAAAAALLLLIGAGALFFINRERSGGIGQARTLALMPFTATSSDPSLRALAAQARDSVAHAFSDSGVPVKLIDSATPANGKPAADYLLTADLSGDANKITATVRLEDAAQQTTVWTRQIDADRKDAADLPDRVGAQVAGALSWSGTMRTLDPSDTDLTAKLLQLDIGRDPLQNYQNAARVAAQYPDVPFAQLSLAMYTAFALGDLPREQRPQALAAARKAAERAKSMMPHFGDVYIPACILQPFPALAECEDHLRAGLKADPDAPFVNTFLSYRLQAVGRDSEAYDRASLSYQHDPYMPAKIALMIHMMENVGARADADDLYRQGVKWWPEWGFFRGRVIGIVERGDFDALRQVELEPGAQNYGPQHKDTVALVAAVKSRSLPDLKRTCADSGNSFYGIPCMLAFAKLGDLDSAYAIAEPMLEREVGRTPAETEKMWLDNPDNLPLNFITSPAAAPMRRDPRFMAIAERTGLLAYWRTGRAPDFCRKNPEPECPALMKR